MTFNSRGLTTNQQVWTSQELREVWDSVLRILETALPDATMKMWVRPLKIVRIRRVNDQIEVGLGAQNDFSVEQVKGNLAREISTALTQCLGESCKIEVESLLLKTGSIVTIESQELDGVANANDLMRVGGSEVVPEVGHERTDEESRIVGGRALDERMIRGPEQRPVHDNPIDPRYTFKNFVVGSSNHFAHAGAVAVAELPARRFNPVFIYGPPGLGKSHLLYAIGNHVISERPNARVAYLSAEKFVNELVESLQRGRMPQFRTKYRDSYDIILIDDIQFIAGKSTSEEEFFHTFNALHSSKRQIVVTCDRSPKEVEGLAERIRTRFEWGLVTSISPPEIETRIAILKAKAERDDIYLPDDVATVLTTYVKNNVRELEGLLIRLQAQASLTGAEISIEMAKQEMKATFFNADSGQYAAEAILSAVVKYFQLKPQDLRSQTKARQVAFPRQIGMYLMRKYTQMGLKEIGSYFGGKDHTTILYACKKMETSLEKDHAVRAAVEAVQNLL